ncbi:patched domain-containing protein 3-like [Mercenaria mercenaria]|uniref:patched domain-containing protein 3-like n=1 Tax=Mercenaria mercenaria TaxID=6596 RepID=UPI00234F12F6|nr:patched domain-containing protein 3-like [Mercenaria mercenaria]
MMKNLNTCYEFVESKIGAGFARYGRFVSHHAWKIIMATVIVNGALGIGMIKLQSDIEIGNVYLPFGTESRDDLARVDDIFSDLSGSNFNPLTVSIVDGLYARVIVRATSGNLLDKTVLEEIKTMSNFIQNIETKNDNGSTIKFSDVCARSHSRCAVEGNIFWDEEFFKAIDNNNVTYPVFVSSSAGGQDYSSVVGKVTLDSTGKYLTSMEFLRLGFNIRTDEDKYKVMAEKWVAEFLIRLQSYTGSDKFEFAYRHHNSLNEELDENVSGDIALFAATIAMMITYACVATLSSRITDQVGQRMWLGFGGILAAGLAIVSSFGICATCGVDFVSIVGIVPFLIIGIGIDDMFILLSGLSEAQTKQSVEDKIAETLRISGVGITITSVTDFIAFMVGSGSSFIAVRNFCIYTGVAVVFCYINNVTLFAACIAINERRVRDNRHYMTCRRIQTKEVLKIENKSKKYILCCGGRPPRNREEAESFVDKLPRWLIPKIVLKLPFKIMIIILFLGYLAAAIYGCVNLKQGLLFTQLVSDDSYFFKYSEWEQNYFKRNDAVTFVIPSTRTYSKPETQSMIDELISSVQSNNYFDDDFEVNWLKTYMNSEYINGSSESEFIFGLQKFLSDPRYSIFVNDVKIDSINNHITSSRVYVLTVDLEDSQEEGKMMLESRELASAATIGCFAFAPSFVVYEQYVRILGQTLQSVGIALVSVFIITCIFMPHPVMIIFVTVVVTMIMTGVFGFMYYIDVALSAITMINIIMSIGFSVDFTAHICHGYMISNGATRDIRVKQAIDKTGAPIFHGAVSSLLGILVLVAAKSYIFRTFAAVMSFVLLFGIAHALLLLPVILSWIGPGRINSGDEGTIPEDKLENETVNANNDMINFKKYATVYKLYISGSDGEYSWHKIK